MTLKQHAEKSVSANNMPDNEENEEQRLRKILLEQVCIA